MNTANIAIRSPFLKTWHAVALLLLLIFSLALPFFFHSKSKAARAKIYSALPLGHGPVYFYHDAIFTDQASPIDFLFIGESTMWTSIDVKVIKDWFLKNRGIEINSLVLAGNWPGEERNYLLLRELLEHRKVRFVFFNVLTHRNDGLHPIFKYLWNPYYDQIEFAGVPLQDQISLYAESIIGGPRKLIQIFRPDGPLSDVANSVAITANQGAFLRDAGMQPQNPGALALKFEAIDIFPKYIDPETYTYRWTNNPKFKLTNHPIFDELEKAFLSHSIRLARSQGAEINLIKMPDACDENKELTLLRDYSSELKDQNVSIYGIPFVDLFPSNGRLHYNRYDYTSFFYNCRHLNSNGARYFTRALLPFLVQVYDKKN
jgi:hypothetical protein